MLVGAGVRVQDQLELPLPPGGRVEGHQTSIVVVAMPALILAERGIRLRQRNRPIHRYESGNPVESNGA
jgi:hypothetical protein